MTPNAQAQEALEDACLALDIEAVRAALAQGAVANAEDEDGCPLVILATIAVNGGDIKQKHENAAQIVTLLFEHGAQPDDQWQPERWQRARCGLQHAIEQTLITIPISNGTWDKQAALGLVEIWLSAGANPDPTVEIDKKSTGIVEHVAWFSEFLVGKDEDPEDRSPSPEGALIEDTVVDLIVLLQRYGCVVSDQRLSDVKFSPLQIGLIKTGIAQGQIERATGAAVGTPRTPRL